MDKTFSGVVDEAIQRTRRPGLVNDIVSYANATIRECQIKALFARDLVEDVLTATSENYVWLHGTGLRVLRTAYYTNLDIWPKFIAPGRKQGGESYYYYRGPTYYTFVGVASGYTINVAYYRYLDRLKYYASGSNPAYFDTEEFKWYYLQDDGTYADALATTELEEAAVQASSNWLLQDWFDLILEGTVAKIFKNQKDERDKSTYAQYKSYQSDLISGEATDALDY